MDDSEQLWEQHFSPLGHTFAEVRPNYQEMGQTNSIAAALYWLELEMYNGGFIQFFCNWGYDAYLLVLKGLETIGATATQQLLTQAYGIIQRFEDDNRLESLWDIPQYVTDDENLKLNEVDQEYWKDKETIMHLMLLTFHPELIEPKS